MKHKQHGFAVAEMLVLLVMVGAIGLVSWLVWQQRVSVTGIIPSLPETAQASMPAAYQRTATIPADWPTYTDPDYGFSLAYPPTWTVTTSKIPKTVGYDTQNVYSTEASELYVVCYLPPGWKQSCAAELNYNNQRFEDSLAQMRAYVSRFAAGGTSKVDEAQLLYDGLEAAVFTTKQTDDAPIQKDYFVSANKGTYALPTVYESDPQDGGLKGVLSAADSLRLFESVTITPLER